MSADAEGIKGTQDFPRGDHTQTVCAYFRRWLRRSLLLPYKPLQNARYYYPIRDEADLIAYVWARDLGCDTHEDTSGIRTHIRPGHIKGHIFLTDLGRTTLTGYLLWQVKTREIHVCEHVQRFLHFGGTYLGKARPGKRWKLP
jgi:hypothetical protein